MTDVLIWQHGRYRPTNTWLTKWHIVSESGRGLCGGLIPKNDRDEFRSDSLYPAGDHDTCQKCEALA